MKKIITFIITAFLFTSLMGCSLMPFKEPNPNNLKKSPCACDPLGKEFKTFGEG